MISGTKKVCALGACAAADAAAGFPAPFVAPMMRSAPSHAVSLSLRPSFGTATRGAWGAGLSASPRRRTRTAFSLTKTRGAPCTPIARDNAGHGHSGVQISIPLSDGSEGQGDAPGWTRACSIAPTLLRRRVKTTEAQAVFHKLTAYRYARSSIVA